MLADLASALAARDPATAAHCARVTFMSRRLAVWLRWDDRKLRTVDVGAPLHDIGKVTISEALLRKRGPLLPHELAEIRTHPAAGAKLISPIGPARDALPYVLYHHERWDGGGYPTGRRGTPVGQRPLAEPAHRSRPLPDHRAGSSRFRKGHGLPITLKRWQSGCGLGSA
jgi:HD-GYP domain-containing protein (c-di-GMP phosphodiesterase class II)